MAVHYKSVGWNRQKRIYDLTLLGFVIVFIGLFVAVTLVRNPNSTIETLIIRSTSLTAFVLLNVILCIGPLCRLDRRFLPLLYNRRHLGVTMFLLALAHAIVVIIQYHSQGDENPLVSVFTAYRRDYDPFIRQTANIANFPFEPLGFFALVILFLMAATSHDFWLKNLGASVWKSIHLFVFAAYGLIVGHVALGVLQSERSPVFPALLLIGVGVVLTLHLLAARREWRKDGRRQEPAADGYIEACALAELREAGHLCAVVAGERVALFLHEGRVYALSNCCRHQGGPIGEGIILDGTVTCPWHGWQYRPEDGCSPPPFKEVLATYNVRIGDGRVLVHPTPNPLETRAEGASVPS